MDRFRFSVPVNIKLFLIPLLAALMLFGAAAPAMAVAMPDRGGEGYTSVLYDSTSGLPTSDANAIVQSPEGFLWIGNYSGLIRYDGNDFYRYPSSTGVSSVVSLFCDSRGRLWIGTNDKGVGVLENDSFTFYDRDQGLLSSSVRSILEDPDGNILIATTSGMAYVDPEGQLHVLDDPQINREYVCELVTDGQGLVYGVTLSGALFTVEDLRLRSFYDPDALGVDVANTVFPDPHNPGYIYIGTQQSTVVYGDLTKQMKGRRTVSVSPLNQVNSIRELNGLLWLCADNGVGYLDGDLRFTPVKNIPMNNSIDHIMADFEGNLWFTSSRQGVMKIVPNRFTDLSEVAGLPPLVVNSTCLHDGLLYIAADSGLTILDEDDLPVANGITELLTGVRIRCVKADSRGQLWFCTNSDLGLVRYDPDSGDWRSYNLESGLASNRARTFLELSDGALAVATNAGLNVLRGGEITEAYGSAQGISNTEILTVEEAPDGRLYLGSDGDGIYVVDRGGVSRLGRKDGLDSEVILRLKRDVADPELYWIITSSSIAWMRDDAITVVRNFPYSNNYDLYFDDDGRLWILSSAGIYVVKRDDLLRDENIDYTLYDTRSGLPCTATANSYSHLDGDGVLYIAATTGVATVNIFHDTDSESRARLAVPYVMADDQYLPVGEDGTIRIPARCRRLTIYPYAFTYSLNNPHLRYYLENFDTEPTAVTRQQLDAVSYTNLAGGTYRFHLSEVNTMTGAEDQALTVTIVKDKTLYEQLWFRILLLVLAAGLAGGGVWLFFHHKTQVLLRKQAEHKELINEMTSVFASCIDMKDAYTNGHSHRVAKYTAMLARRLGKTEEEVEELYNIALLHDIGKISIPDKILNKPEKLTDDEYQVMKNHSQRGYEILKEIAIDPQLSQGAGYHHERVDGKGYPRGLKGEEIPEAARIIAVADTFDAMYSTRPYRKRLALDVVANEIQRSAGTQLDESVVAAFMELVQEGAFDNE